MGKRSWTEIKKHIRVIFLTSIASQKSDRENEKNACKQLSKVLKSIILSYGNVYTNKDDEELKQVLAILIPMILDDCLKSRIKAINKVGLDLLTSILINATQS